MLVNHCPCWQLFCQELGQSAGAAQAHGSRAFGKSFFQTCTEYMLLMAEAVPSLSPVQPAAVASTLPQDTIQLQANSNQSTGSPQGVVRQVLQPSPSLRCPLVATEDNCDS